MEREKHLMMKEFKPSRYFNLPIWIDLIIKTCIVSLLFTLLPALNIEKIIGLEIPQSVSLLEFWIWNVIIIYIYKLFITFSPVDYVRIEAEREEITICYWFLYFIKRKITLEKNAFTVSVKMHHIFSNSLITIRFYKNYKIKVILNARNGWSESMNDEIVKELQNSGATTL